MIRLYVFMAVILMYGVVHGQGTICTGNLGDNIFTQGDFGRGSANILPVDPGIAPGFQYVTYVPFDDGKYTITNSMALWPDIFPTWLRIGDNSTDVQGYMMVVNASYAPGIFYQQTVDGLCDNTLYEFSADVINIVRRDVLNHIFPNVSFLIDGDEKFTTGPIPQSELWETHGFTFYTLPGQEAVTLTLRNNAPGGIGNDLALDNISFRPCGPKSEITIDMNGKVCENTLYPTLSAIIASDTGFVQWQISTDLGALWSDIPGATDRTYQSTQLSAQTYLFRYLYGNTIQHLQNEKCRIVSDYRSLEVVPVHFSIVDTLCEDLAFDLGGTLYSTSGVYLEHLTALNGCDSIVTLSLTIVPDPGIEAELFTTPPSCSGGNDGMIGLTQIYQGTPPYLFNIEGHQGQSNDSSLAVAAGLYTIQVSDRYHCSVYQLVDIIDPIPFTITASGGSTIVLGHSASLDVAGNYPINDITWEPAVGLSCSTCVTTEATPLGTTEYFVTAISTHGCVANDTVVLSVDSTPRIFIPNVFTPNGDQVNDTWGIYADPLNLPQIERLVIFDRWGAVVINVNTSSSIGAEDLWDGRFGTEDMGSGIYVYVLELKQADGHILKLNGTITLLR